MFRGVAVRHELGSEQQHYHHHDVANRNHHDAEDNDYALGHDHDDHASSSSPAPSCQRRVEPHDDDAQDDAHDDDASLVEFRHQRFDDSAAAAVRIIRRPWRTER
jgi:hypothetical protein